MKKALLVILFFVTGIVVAKSQVLLDSADYSDITAFASYDSTHFAYCSSQTTFDPILMYTCLKATTDGGKSWKTIWADTSKGINDFERMIVRGLSYQSKELFVAIGSTNSSGEYERDRQGYTFHFSYQDGLIDKHDNFVGTPEQMSFSDSLHGVASVIWCNLGNMIKTEDGGNTWSYYTIYNKESMRINYLKMAGCDSIVYRGINLDTRGNQFGFSYNGGKTWTETRQDTLCWSATAISFVDAKTGYIGGWQHAPVRDSATRIYEDSSYSLAPRVQKTTDGGLTWKTVFASENLNYEIGMLSTGYDNTLFVVTLFGQFFRSTDGGTTWDTLRARNYGPVVKYMMPYSKRTLVYLGEMNFVAKWTETITTAEEPNEAITDILIFPNPCTESAIAVIRADVPAMAKLRLVNSLGESIWNTSEWCTAGENRIALDVSGLSTGYYFCEVQLNGNRYLAKVVVNK